jgi:hypothetical protein
MEPTHAAVRNTPPMYQIAVVDQKRPGFLSMKNVGSGVPRHKQSIWPMLIACRAEERNQIASGPHKMHANSLARHEGLASLRLFTNQTTQAVMAIIVTVKNKVVSCNLTRL